MNILSLVVIALVAATLLLIWRMLGGRRRTIALYGMVVISAGLSVAALFVEGAMTA